MADEVFSRARLCRDMTGNPVTELERAFRRMGRHFGVLSARRERPSTGLDVRDPGETFEVVGETPGARPDDSRCR